MQLSIGHSWHHYCRQLGTWHWVCEHMDQHTVSSDTGIAVNAYCAKGGNSDLLYGEDKASELSRWNSFTSMVAVLREEGAISFSTPVPFEPMWGSCSNLDMTALK